MPHPKCFTSSSIGPAPELHKNFLDRPEQVVIYWDDAKVNTNDGAFLRVFHHCEPPEVFPEVADKIIAEHRLFDVVMSYDPRVLRECPNAVFLTESACSWLDRKASGSPAPFIHSFPDGAAPLSPVVENYTGCDSTKKEFAVSFLTSSKAQFPGHVLRQEIFSMLPESISTLRVWKHRSPPRVEDKRPTLEPYMFSVVCENSFHEGYFTEKIVDCFVAKTVPIYWGCPDLSRYGFDSGGVLRFDKSADVVQLLSRLSPEIYKRMLPSVEKNFYVALRSVRQWDLIEKYITEGISRKHSGVVSGRQDEQRQSMHSNTQSIQRPLRWSGRKSANVCPGV